jgi:hypothetical protein
VSGVCTLGRHPNLYYMNLEAVNGKHEFYSREEQSENGSRDVA